MAESQGKLGDNWNDCACRLLNLLGWQHIGDKNMDLTGSDDKEYGVDSILKYEVAGRSMKQTAVLESKRYAQTSIQNGTLKKWLERLKDKLGALRNSKELLNEYPELEECSPTNLGIVIVWVHDATEEYLNETFQNHVNNTVISTGARAGAYSRIMVLDNRRIVCLCSMIEALQKYSEYHYVYPSGIIDNDVITHNKTLSVEYMMSDVIFAEGKKDGKESSIVFYFGEMTESAITSLLECLKVFQRVQDKKPLEIYYYYSNDKCIDVINSFKQKESYKGILDFKKLTHYAYNDEPSLIANNDR